MASVNKPTYFNIDKDKDLLKFSNGLPSFSTWVKEKIREELRLQSQQIQKPDVAARPEEGVKREPLVWKL